MRTSLMLFIGFLTGVAGTWYLVSEPHMTSRTVPSAYAETIAAAAEEKPWTAAELEEIAKFYENAADGVEDEALHYERKAASITPLTDTKGFRRSALSIAAQSKWKEAAELRLLAAEHREKAQRMYAKEGGK